MDETWRIFTAAVLLGLLAAAIMLLSSNPDTGNKSGGQTTIGAGAADLKATYRAIRGSNDLRA